MHPGHKLTGPKEEKEEEEEEEEECTDILTAVLLHMPVCWDVILWHWA
jgi:hypothetical protein